MLTSRPKISKRAYFVLLIVLAMSCFGIFSGLEMNTLFKLYGLTFSLQAGFALLYFGRRSR